LSFPSERVRNSHASLCLRYALLTPGGAIAQESRVSDAVCEDESLPFFGKRTAPPSEAEIQAAAVDLERIRRGGIPLGAEQRLKAIAEGGPFVFSSDLSAKEYALAQASGLTPVAQIMGSSVVQQGWQSYGFSPYGGGIQELAVFAQPWNVARQRAFERLHQEARFAGADAVIGIEMTVKGFLDEPGNIEYLVFGTAMRETTLRGSRDRELRMCALSGQDVDKLRRIGAETVGVLGHTSVVSAALSGQANRMMGSWWGNQEMTDVSRGVYAARRLAMNEVRRQGQAVGANEIVISQLTHDIRHIEYESGGGFRQHYFIISMHVLGTAIRLGAHQPHPSPLGAPVLSVNLGV
jgi:uncharacterized protein YbjQ (UPF0145 family)